MKNVRIGLTMMIVCLSMVLVEAYATTAGDAGVGQGEPTNPDQDVLSVTLTTKVTPIEGSAPPQADVEHTLVLCVRKGEGDCPNDDGTSYKLKIGAAVISVTPTSGHSATTQVTNAQGQNTGQAHSVNNWVTSNDPATGQEQCCITIVVNETSIGTTNGTLEGTHSANLSGESYAGSPPLPPVVDAAPPPPGYVTHTWTVNTPPSD